MTPMSPGSVLAGRYRLSDLLEETGGARFWRATDLILVRDVAVHVLAAEDPRTPALFEAARSSALVSGHHVLRVLDAVIEDGVAYVVNEWGEGLSLDRMLLEGPLPPRKAAWIVREVADALASAHSAGICHGRLVPENVLLTDTGSVKLIGFVIDAALHGMEAPADPVAVDVHGLGSLLYTALVGRWPGTVDSSVERAPVDHGRVLRPRQVRAGVPPVLDRICDDIVNGSDEHPITSALEVRALLSDFLGEAVEPPKRAASAYDPEATQIGLPSLDDLDDVVGGGQGGDPPGASSSNTAAVPVLTPAVITPTPPVVSTPTAAEWSSSASPPATAARTPYVGMGGGGAAASWGPDQLESDDPSPRRTTPWLMIAAIVAVVIVLVVAVALALGLGGKKADNAGDGDGSPATTPGRSTSGQPLDLAAVKDFDPFAVGGPKTENPEEVPLAHDGDPATAWHTMTYKDGPDLTVYKPGVGLLLDLGSDQDVGSVQLTMAGSPNTVDLLAAPEGTTAAPTGVNGLSKVAEVTDGGTTISLKPSSSLHTRFLVVWLTGLPRGDGGFRGGIAEIVVRS
jgi:Protein kinase domain